MITAKDIVIIIRISILEYKRDSLRFCLIMIKQVKS